VRRKRRTTQISARRSTSRAAARIGATFRAVQVDVLRCRTSSRRTGRDSLPLHRVGLDHGCTLPTPPEIAGGAYFLLQLEARAHLKPFTRLPLMECLTLVRTGVWCSIPTMPWPTPGWRRLPSHCVDRDFGPPPPLRSMRRCRWQRRLPARDRLDEGLAGRVPRLACEMEYDWYWTVPRPTYAHASALNSHPARSTRSPPSARFPDSRWPPRRSDRGHGSGAAARPRSVRDLQHPLAIATMAGQGTARHRALDYRLRCLQGLPRAHYGRMIDSRPARSASTEANGRRLTTRSGG